MILVNYYSIINNMMNTIFSACDISLCCFLPQNIIHWHDALFKYYLTLLSMTNDMTILLIFTSNTVVHFYSPGSCLVNKNACQLFLSDWHFVIWILTEFENKGNLYWIWRRHWDVLRVRQQKRLLGQTTFLILVNLSWTWWRWSHQPECQHCSWHSTYRPC